jgi:flagellar protein FlbD
MIKVSRLNNEEYLLNPHLIEVIEATPDTVITLTTGKRFVVKEKIDEVVKRIFEYRRMIGDRSFTDYDTLNVSPEDDSS